MNGKTKMNELDEGMDEGMIEQTKRWMDLILAQRWSVR